MRNLSVISIFMNISGYIAKVNIQGVVRMNKNTDKKLFNKNKIMKKERTSQTQHILYMLNHAKVCIEKIVDYSDFCE